MPIKRLFKKPVKNWALALNQFEILCGDSGYDLTR